MREEKMQEEDGGCGSRKSDELGSEVLPTGVGEDETTR
jgi:hypothetical protein